MTSTEIAPLYDQEWEEWVQDSVPCACQKVANAAKCEQEAVVWALTSCRFKVQLRVPMCQRHLQLLTDQKLKCGRCAREHPDRPLHLRTYISHHEF